MKASQIMSRNVAQIPVEASLYDAAQEMKKHNVGMLPVVANGTVSGVITDRDIVVEAVADNLNLSKTLVQDIMSKNPVILKEDHEVDDVAVLMSENQVGRVIITDDNQKPIGVISLGDLGVMMQDREAVASVLAEVGKRSMK